MTVSDQSETRDPAEIEREIRATQREMSRTADQIGDQFTPKNIFNALLDKADENGIDARYMLDGARRNPIALAMIALGGIWLVSDSDAKAPSLKLPGLGMGRSESDGDWQSPNFHREYVEHMSRCEPRSGEDDVAYRRRRDLARANYLMIEQGHDEDETSFRDRLNAATDTLREKRDSLLEGAKGMSRDMTRSARNTASDVSGKVDTLYRENPLVGGVIAALAGAIAGAALPATRIEEEQLGSIGAQALGAAKDKAYELGDAAREKKDALVDEARGSLEG